MCETIDFETKVQIIRTADLEDAQILVENYDQLIYESNDSSIKDVYVILKKTAKQRVTELKDYRND